MAESPNPEPVDGSGSQPVDPRPKPQFGELAPPGWVWKPPADSHTGHQQEPMVVHKQPHTRQPAAPKPAAEPKSGAALEGTEPPAWDRPVTIALLVLGVFGLFSFVRIQAGATQSIALLYQQEGLGAYTPSTIVPTILLWGGIIQIALWVLAAGLSISLMVRRRRAFWIPLLVGVLAVIALFLVLMAVLLTDPTLIDHFAKQTG
ncbi:MAG: DUF6264 family protein [Leifsonia sp.]